MAKSKLTKCKTCGADVAKSATVCPSCGAKLKKRHPVLGILIFIFGIILFIAGISGIGSSENAKPVDKHSNQNIEVQEEKTTFGIGEAADLRGVQATLVSVKESKGSAYNKPADGNVFLLCEFDISNNTDHEIAISSIVSFSAYCDDYACNFSLNGLIEKGDKNQLDGEIAAGKKLNGVVAYEVAKDWKSLELHFTPEFWKGNDIVFVASH